MKNELAELIEPLKELLAIKTDLERLVAKESSPLNLATKRFHGAIAPVSFRTYQGVAEDFRAFAAGIKGLKNQDLVAQALVEFMDRHQHLSVPPLRLGLGSELVRKEERTQIFSSLIKEIRAQITAKSGKTAPQVRIYENTSLGKREYLIETDQGQEFAGSCKENSLAKIKERMTGLMQAKARP